MTTALIKYYFVAFIMLNHSCDCENPDIAVSASVVVVLPEELYEPRPCLKLDDAFVVVAPISR